MPVVKEFTCDACGCEFQRIRAECPSCDSTNVHRAFRTAPGINKGSTHAGSAKRFDQIIDHQFAKLGIDNFKTMEFGRANKVTWSPKRFRDGPGYVHPDQTYHGVEQAEIEAGFGLNGLIQSGMNPGALRKDGEAFSIPTDVHGAYIPPGTRVGGPPTALFKETNVVGGIDVRGNQVVRVK